MRTIAGWAVAAAGAALLASCATPTPAPKVVQASKPVARDAPYRWTQGNAPAAYREAVTLFGPLRMRPGEYRWVEDVPKTGEARIVIDLLTQLFYVYRGDRLVGVSTISSGKNGKETQLGVWAVRLKKVKGYSRKYDNAPMPYMQMYDEAGLAFHAGQNPGYPASHGCVRLPLKFAAALYPMTRIGTKVIIEG